MVFETNKLAILFLKQADAPSACSGNNRFCCLAAWARAFATTGFGRFNGGDGARDHVKTYTLYQRL